MKYLNNPTGTRFNLLEGSFHSAYNFSSSNYSISFKDEGKYEFNLTCIGNTTTALNDLLLVCQIKADFIKSPYEIATMPLTSREVALTGYPDSLPGLSEGILRLYYTLAGNTISRVFIRFTKGDYELSFDAFGNVVDLNTINGLLYYGKIDMDLAAWVSGPKKNNYHSVFEVPILMCGSYVITLGTITVPGTDANPQNIKFSLYYHPIDSEHLYAFTLELGYINYVTETINVILEPANNEAKSYSSNAGPLMQPLTGHYVSR